jgi:hypothetical protein
MWIFDRWSPYSLQNNRDKYKEDEEQREFTLKECLWFCMTSLTPQGGGEAPKNLSGRLVAATWWLFGYEMILLILFFKLTNMFFQIYHNSVVYCQSGCFLDRVAFGYAGRVP